MMKQLLKLLKEKTSSTFGDDVLDHGKVVKDFFTKHFVGT